MSETPNKQQIILLAIRNGGATRESLMAEAGVNKAGLASQLSYLTQRGIAMAEVDESKAEYPMAGADGIYFMGTHQQFMEKRANSGGNLNNSKPRSKSQVAEAAQKREDRASAAYSSAEKRASEKPDDAILAKTVELRRAELELASLKLARVQAGDYTYETGTIVEDDELAYEGGANLETKPGKTNATINPEALSDNSLI